MYAARKINTHLTDLSALHAAAETTGAFVVCRNNNSPQPRIEESGAAQDLMVRVDLLDEDKLAGDCSEDDERWAVVVPFG
jgi:hypothetical protein